MKNIFFSVLVILFGLHTNATGQLSEVKYLIEYNTTTTSYDCKIVIGEGEATHFTDRVLFNTLYTIVTPTGTELYIDSLFHPKENNITYQGTIPCLWEFGPKEIAPPTTPQLDYQTVFPNLSPPSFFDDLHAGDTVTLFSVYADVDPCLNAIRPFENDTDPSSLDMPSGGDFRNGITIGGSTQLYGGNIKSTYGENYITNTDSLFVCEGDCITLDPTTACSASSIEYLWSTGETTSSIEVCPTEPTTYSLQITNSLGVQENLSVVVGFGSTSFNSNPNVLCAGDSFLLETCGTNTWAALNDNPEGAIVSTQSSSQYLVKFDEASGGTYRFQYTFENNTTKELEIKVNPKPILTLESTELCLGSTMNVTSNLSEGVWTSNNPTIAVINDTGLVTPFNVGMVRFDYFSLEGCHSETEPVSIYYGIEAEVTGPDTICYNETTTLSSNSDGYWESSDSSIVEVDNSDNITGVSSGTASLVQINPATGCQSNPVYITVISEPAEFIGPNQICIGETTSLSPSSGGTWYSTDPSIVSVENNGLVAGLSTGVTNLIWTSNIGGCQSLPLQITVSKGPILSVESSEVCIGETFQLYSNEEGVWESSNDNIALVNPETGFTVGVSEGSCGFKFISDNGCTAYINDITIHPAPPAQVLGDLVFCVGQTTFLGPVTGGTWVSSNSNIASVDNIGMVTGLSPGQAYFTFTSSSTGCSSEPTEVIVVLEENDPACLVNVDEIEASNILVYPNPANDFIAIESQTKIEYITLFSANFSKVREESFNQDLFNLQWDTQNLKSGLYILAIQSKGKTHYQKIIIE